MPTSIKDALKKWEDTKKTAVSDAKEVYLCLQLPPINKMDNTLSSLENCTKLSLSSNQIEKVAGIGTLKKLKVLCLARNQIKSLSGLEQLGETLEQLWMSYNGLSSLKGISSMKSLKVFYIAYNNIKDWTEVARMAECPNLQELLFLGNPLVDQLEEAVGRAEITKRVPKLRKLDGDPVIE